ncbi:hypothetical protein F4781DRAFT_441195 [Annulohypoxylon bovei var. microspora]|nr:hypothetical protein F4781DRAFT_441195 [Annulohypoxylon bovei var. microspora]
MKSINALLCLAGIASGAAIQPMNFEKLGNGMYTIPLVGGRMDFSRATRDPFNVTSAAPDYQSVIDGAERNTTSTPSALSVRKQPGTCVPQFPTRVTFCRARKIKRIDYLRAYAKYLDWIETGPDEGWVPKHSCKSLVWGFVVVSTCSTGGPNPTCRAELVEAMRELDTYCAELDGGDIKIHHWKKRYSRHNIRDGDDLQRHTTATFELGEDEAEAGDVEEVQDASENEVDQE